MFPKKLKPIHKYNLINWGIIGLENSAINFNFLIKNEKKFI